MLVLSEGGRQCLDKRPDFISHPAIRSQAFFLCFGICRQARRIVKPGQVFNRIHVDDIAAVAVRLIEAGGPGGLWNVADEEPAPPQDVIVFAAERLGVAPPPAEDFATARLTPMARSFYDDNRRVDVGRLRRELGYRWLYPTYRDGLRALAAAGEGRATT